MADSVYQRADFNFMRNFNTGIMMGWKPAFGFSGFGQWIGYNEAMILYILALGSPSYAVPTSAWSAWTSGYHYNTLNGYSFVTCPPLFTHQYSHCWIDFRDIADAYMRFRGHDYFENSRRATLAQRNYCIANPGGWVAYSDSLWGLTAGDGPTGYTARGAPPAQNDNGTITPTAAISSIVFTPDESIGFIHYMWDHLRPTVWGPYGWKDGFNPTAGWVGTDVIGIDQGPILVMIENYLNGKPWARMKAFAPIQNGLARADFQPFVLDVKPPATVPLALGRVTPDPVRDRSRVSLTLPRSAALELTLLDLQGRAVRHVASGTYAAGEHAFTIERDGLTAGIYWLRLRSGGQVRHARFAVLP
jgi:hypothetical protein